MPDILVFLAAVLCLELIILAANKLLSTVPVPLLVVPEVPEELLAVEHTEV